MNNGQVTFDVDVRLNVVQDSIKAIQKLLSEKLSPDTKAYKELSRILEQLTKQATNFQAQVSKGFSSQGQINKADRDLERMEQGLSRVGVLLGQVNYKDLRIPDDVQRQFDDLQTRVEQATQALENAKKAARDIFLTDSKNVADLSKLKIKADDLDFDEIEHSVKKALEKATQNVQNFQLSLDVSKAQLKGIDQLSKIFKNGIGGAVAGIDWTEYLNSAGNFKAGGKRAFVDMLVSQLGLSDDSGVVNDLLSRTGRNLNTLLAQVIDPSATLDATGTKIRDALTRTFSRLQNDVNTNTKNLLDAQGAEQAAQRILKAFADLSKAGTPLGTAFETFRRELNLTEAESENLKKALLNSLKDSPKVKDNLGALSQQLNSLKQSLKNTNTELLRQQSIVNTFNGIKQAVVNFMGFNQILNLTRNAIRQATEHIKQLDETMNGISIVTNMTTADLWEQVDVYTAIAEKYGVTIQGAYEVSKIYYQAGYQTNDVLTLMNETLKLSKVSGLDYAKSTDYMMTALRGFKIEVSEASTVVDVYSNLAANTAVSQEELAIAMSKTASSLEGVGASFEEASAMIATMEAVTRESATNIGTAMKSIASRYGEMKKDPLGFSDEEMEDIDYNKVDTALKSVGISLKDTEGNFRNMTDVILELSDVWDTLSSAQQRYIATQFAGNRMQSRFLALVSNGDLLRRNIETATAAEGTGTVQMLKTLDSLESKINRVQVAWQQFYTTLGLENAWKGILDFLHNFINTLNNMPKLFNKIPVGAVAIVAQAILLVKNLLYKGIENIAKIIHDTITDGKIQESGKENADAITNGFIATIKSRAHEYQRAIHDAVTGASTTAASNISATDLATLTTSKTGVTNLLNGVASGVTVVPSSANTEVTSLVDAITNCSAATDGLKAKATELQAAYSSGNVDQYRTALQNLSNELDRVTASSSTATEGTKTLRQQFFESKTVTSWVTGLQAGVGIISTIFGTTTEKGRQATAVLQGVAGALGLVRAALLIIQGSNPIGWITAIASSIVMFWTAHEAAIETAEEKLERLKNTADELHNEAAQAKNDLTTLQTSINKVEELKEKRHESAEAAEEYQTAVDDLAESFPELIAGFDEAGNIILDTRDAEELLTASREKNYEVTKNAAQAEYNYYKQRSRDKQIELYNRLNNAGLSDDAANAYKAATYGASSSSSSLDMDAVKQGYFYVTGTEWIEQDNATISTLETLATQNPSILENNIQEQLNATTEDAFIAVQAFQQYWENVKSSAQNVIEDAEETSSNEQDLNFETVYNFFKNLQEQTFTINDPQGKEAFKQAKQAFMRLQPELQHYFNDLGLNFNEFSVLFSEGLSEERLALSQAKIAASQWLNNQIDSELYKDLEGHSNAALMLSNALAIEYNRADLGEDVTFEDWVGSDGSGIIDKFLEFYQDIDQELLEELIDNREHYNAGDVKASIHIDPNDNSNPLNTYIDSMFDSAEKIGKDLAEEFNQLSYTDNQGEKQKGYRKNSPIEKYVATVTEFTSLSEEGAEFFLEQGKQANKVIENGYSTAGAELLSVASEIGRMVENEWAEDPVEQAKVYRIFDGINLLTKEGVDAALEAIDNSDLSDDSKQQLTDTLSGYKDTIVENILLSIESTMDGIVDEVVNATEQLEKVRSGVDISGVRKFQKYMKDNFDIDVSFGDFEKNDKGKWVLIAKRDREITEGIQTHYNSIMKEASKIQSFIEETLGFENGNFEKNSFVDWMNRYGTIRQNLQNASFKEGTADYQIKEFLEANHLLDEIYDDSGRLVDNWQIIFGEQLNTIIELANETSTEYGHLKEEMEPGEEYWAKGDYTGVAGARGLALSGQEILGNDVKSKAAKNIRKGASQFISDVVNKGIESINWDDYIESGMPKSLKAQLKTDLSKIENGSLTYEKFVLKWAARLNFDAATFNSLLTKGLEQDTEKIEEADVGGAIEKFLTAESMTSSEVLKYAKRLGIQGEEISEVASELGLKQNKQGNWERTADTLETLKEKLTELENDSNADFKEINRLKAQIDSLEGLSNLDNAVLNIFNNSSKITTEMVKALADALEIDYNKVIEVLKDNGDNTYTLDYNALINLIGDKYGELAKTTLKAGEKVVSDTSSSIIKEVSTATSYFSKGTTNIEDFKDIAETLGKDISEISVWDNDANSYFLTGEALQKYIKERRKKLLELKESDDELVNLLETETDNLRNNIDIGGYLSGNRSETSRNSLEKNISKYLSVVNSEKYDQQAKRIFRYGKTHNEIIEELQQNDLNRIMTALESNTEAAIEVAQELGLDESQIEAIATAKFNEVKTNIEKLQTLTIGSYVGTTGTLVKKLRDAGIEVSNTGYITSINKATQSLSEIYDEYIQEYIDNANTIADIFEGAKMQFAHKNAGAKARYNMLNTNVSFDDIMDYYAAVYQDAGMSLESAREKAKSFVEDIDLEGLGLTELAPGEYEIIDWTRYKNTFLKDIPETSQKYINAYSSFLQTRAERETNNVLNAAISDMYSIDFSGIEKLAIGLGESVDTIIGNLEPNRDGTYDISEWLLDYLQEKYGEQLPFAIQEALSDALNESLSNATSELSSFTFGSTLTESTAKLLAKHSYRFKQELETNGEIVINTVEEYQAAVLTVYSITKEAFDNGTATLTAVNDAYIQMVNSNFLDSNALENFLSNNNNFDLSSLGTLFNAIGGEISDFIDQAGNVINESESGIKHLGNGKYTIQNWNKFLSSLPATLDKRTAEYINAYASWLEGKILNNDGSVNKVATDTIFIASIIDSMDKLTTTQLAAIAQQFGMTMNEVISLVEQNADGTYSSNALLTYLEQKGFIDTNNEAYVTALTNKAQSIGSDFTSAITNYISSAHGDYDTATLKKAISTFITSMKGIGRRVVLSEERLFTIIEGGGEQAVTLLGEIARDTGMVLSDSDIETVYRGQASSLVGALDTVTSQIGTIVDKTTADLINASDGYAQQIGQSGKYVVQSAANVVTAYDNILTKLTEVGTATTAELNKAAGAYLDSKFGSATDSAAINALNDAASMTYTRFGEILAAGGIRLTEDLVAQLEASKIIKGLGNGKMAIIDFPNFADFMGWEPNSDEYITAFKAWNDGMIALNKNTSDNIVSEVKSIGSAKGGEWINITTIWGKITQTVDNSIENYMEEANSHLEQSLEEVNYSGNVDFTKRPRISGAQMNKKYPYENFGENDYATLYSQTFNLKDYGFQTTNGQNALANMASITEAGEVLSFEELEAYLTSLGQSTDGSIQELKAADANGKKLLLGIKEYEDTLDGANIPWEEMEEEAFRLHEISEDYEYETTNAVDRISANIREFGATIENGILKLEEDADILGLVQYISELCSEYGLIINEDMLELSQVLDDTLSNYTSIIQKGIKGTATPSEAKELINFAKSTGIESLDFTRTAEGLKLSKESAVELYQELKKIDGMKAELVFDDLYESLTELGSGLENITGTTGKIAQLQREIEKNQTEINNLMIGFDSPQYLTEAEQQRIAALEEQNNKLREQIQLYNQIQLKQMDTPESYAFMDKAVPNYLKGAENYWDAVGKAYVSMNDAGKTGYMSIQDFNNIVNEMNHMAQVSGKNLVFMGQTLDGSAESASKLIQKGMLALTNVDGKGAQVSLKKMGASFAKGAKDMQKGYYEGIQSIAESQIALIDAAIAMLETIVAFDSLKDIDRDNNGILNLDEIFEIDDEGNAKFTEKFEKARANILKVFTETEELKPLLESLTINGVKLGDLLTDDIEELKELGVDEEEYTAIMNGIYKAVQSGNYDLEHIMESVQREIANTGLVFSYYDKKHNTTYTVDMNGGMYTVHWDKEEEVNKIKDTLRAAGFSEEEIRSGAQIRALYDEMMGDNTSKDSRLVLSHAIYTDLVQEVETPEGKKYVYNGQEYTDEREVAKAVIRDQETSGSGVTHSQTLDSGETTEITLNNQLTYTLSFEDDGNGGVKTLYTYDEESSESKEEMFNKIRQKFITDHPDLFEANTSYDKLTEEQRTKIDIATGIQPNISFNVTSEDVANNPDIYNDLLRVRDILHNSTEATAKEVFENENYEITSDDITGNITVDIGGIPVEIAEGDTPEVIQQKIDQALGINNIIAGVSRGIQEAFEGESGAQIAATIAAGLVAAMSNPDAFDISGAIAAAEQAGTTIQNSFNESLAGAATNENNPAQTMLDNATESLTSALSGTKSQWNQEARDLVNGYITTLSETVQSNIGQVTSDGELIADALVGDLESYNPSNLITAFSTILDKLIQILNKVQGISGIDYSNVEDLQSDVDSVLADAKSLKETVDHYANKQFNINFEAKVDQLGDVDNLEGKTVHQKVTTTEERTIDATVNTPDSVTVDGDLALKMDTTEAQTSANELAAKIAAIETPVTSASEAISDNNEEFVKLKKTLETVLEIITKFIEELVKLNSQILTLKNSINNLGKESDTTKGKIDKLKSSIVTLGTNANFQISKINALTSAIINLGDTANGTVISSLGSLKTAINDLGSAASGTDKADSKINNLTTKINALATAANGDGNKSSAWKKLEELRDKLVNKESSTGLVGAIDSIISSTGALQSLIGKITALGTAATTAAGVINTAASSISNITLTPSLTLSASSVQSDINFSVYYKSAASAKGRNNSALVSGRTKTLMGELGPELVVSNGQYYVVGQQGTEFVDLPNDAIVFNHLQTKQILTNQKISGRGRPFTNERNAVAYAKGTEKMANLNYYKGIDENFHPYYKVSQSEYTELGSPAHVGFIRMATLGNPTEYGYSWTGSRTEIPGFGYGTTSGKLAPSVYVSNSTVWDGFYDVPSGLTTGIKEINKNFKFKKAEAKGSVRLSSNLHYPTDGDYPIYSEKMLGALRSMTPTMQNPKKKTFKPKFTAKTSRVSSSQAKGNFISFTGPAHATASEALSALKELRAMWQSMLNASAQQLGSLATSNPNTNPSSDKPTDPSNIHQYVSTEAKTVSEQIQRWYTLLQRIAQLEREITEQQKYRAKLEADRLANGKEIYETYKQEYQNLTNIIERQKELATLQRNWYDAKREELKDSIYGKIFTYDENGVQVYAAEGPGSGKGLDVLEHLTQRNADGSYVMDAGQQVQYLKQLFGNNIKELLNNDDGTTLLSPFDRRNLKNQLIVESGNTDVSDEEVTAKQNEIYASMMTNFFSRIDGWRDELDGLYSSFSDTELKIQENMTKQYEIIQTMVDNEIEIENEIYDAILENRQAEIDRIQEEKDALEEASNNFTDGLTKQLQKEREMYNKNKEDNDLLKLQRRLDILQRSGGSASQIASLQDQIDSKLQDKYFSGQEDQIQTIKDASDKQIERLDKQITLLQTNLDYQKNHGLIWSEVREIMKEDSTSILSKIQAWNPDYASKSSLQLAEDLREIREKLEIYEQYREENNGINNAKRTDYENDFGDTGGLSGNKLSEQARNAFAKWYSNASTYQGLNTTANDSAIYTLKSLSEDKFVTAQKSFFEGYTTSTGTSEEDRLISGLNKMYTSPSMQIGENNPVLNTDKKLAGISVAAKLEEFAKDPYKKEDNQKKKIQITLPAGVKTDHTFGTTNRLSDEEPNKANKEAKFEIHKIGGLNSDGTFDWVYGKWIRENTNGLGPMMKVNALDILDVAEGETFVKKLKNYIRDYLISYKTGGIADYTGPAWLDGTKSSPEAVLNAAQTKFLKEDLLGNSPTSFMSIISAIQAGLDRNALSSINNANSFTIENISLNFETGTISNDYSAKRAGETAMQEIINIARKNGVTFINRR